MEHEYFLLLSRLYNFNLNTNIKYLYCYSYPDDKCLEGLKDQIKKLDKLEKIFVLQCEKPISGYKGYYETIKIITQFNDKVIIEPIPYLYESHKMINTYLESLSVINYLIKNNISRIGIYSPYFHLPRSFITLVSCLIKEKAKIKVYPVSGILRDFNKTSIIHCQGIVRGNANKLIKIEYNRIVKYTKQGDLLPIKLINDYINY